MATIYADEVNYWKTSTTSPESWIEKTKKLIAEIGGKVHSDLIGTINGKTAVMIGFEIAGDQYKIIYTVLAVRDQRDLLAAKRQAVTAMYHEVKALIVSAKFRGIRGAFHSYLVLPDGRTAGELTAPEVAQAIPTAFLLPPPR
jgi:hypothetical protein